MLHFLRKMLCFFAYTIYSESSWLLFDGGWKVKVNYIVVQKK